MNKICTVDDCQRDQYARGLCTPHYQRLRKHGDVQAHIPIGRSRKPCSVDGCTSMSEARGMCMKHYNRATRTGRTDPLPRRPRKRKDPQPCSVDECDRSAQAKGLCSMHYKRFAKHGDPTVIGQSGRPVLDRPTCEVEGCEKVAKAAARPLCPEHYYRWQKYRDPLAPVLRFTDPEDAFAARTRREGDCLVWTGGTESNSYGVLTVNGRAMRAHRYAWMRVHGPIPDDVDIDHRCHNKACVEVSHLRPADAVTNAQNIVGTYSHNTSSGVRGVSWDKGHKAWHAYITYRGKRTHLGYYADKDEAARVAKEARLRVYTHNDEDRGVLIRPGESSAADQV